MVNLQHGDLWPPLSQFNGTLPNKEDVLKLVKTINGARGDEALQGDKFLKSFNRCWNEFEEPFNEILANHKPKEEVNKRSRDDILEEIFELSRSIQRSLQDPEAAQWMYGGREPGSVPGSVPNRNSKLNINLRSHLFHRLQDWV